MGAFVPQVNWDLKSYYDGFYDSYRIAVGQNGQVEQLVFEDGETISRKGDPIV